MSAPELRISFLYHKPAETTPREQNRNFFGAVLRRLTSWRVRPVYPYKDLTDLCAELQRAVTPGELLEMMHLLRPVEGSKGYGHGLDGAMGTIDGGQTANVESTTNAAVITGII